ncbi:high mobility group box domain-containing protein, partial [Scleroderma citrinum]
LVPSDHQWPSFDTAVLYSPSSDSSSPTSSCQSTPSPNVRDDNLPDVDLHHFTSTFPSSAELANMPIPPSRGTSRNKSLNHVPRPRNAFMLFRSAFSAAQKISTNIEHDNRHITRIIAHCWNRLPEADKQVWRDKAASEKAQHMERYPNYRFSPVGRTSKPVKRNVRRNGLEDKKRCEKVAELLLAGKQGKELEVAVKQIDVSLSVEASERTCTEASPITKNSSDDWKPLQGDTDDSEIRPFRSPLLPPAE